MRPNISGSLRRIALGVILPAVLTSTGCYHSSMYPGYGYGTPMYGTPTPGYGGYQGIQTMTPGTYYAPGTAPTYNPNSLTPQADPNASGSSSGTGGQNSGGNNAPPYSPPSSDNNPSRPVPDPSPFYGNEPAGDNSAPPFDSSSQPQTNLNKSSTPATLAKPAANEEWTDIKTVSGPDGSEMEAEEPAQAVELPVAEPALEPDVQEPEVEEEPSLLEPPKLEESDAGKP
ncbi:MAG: hypothetical protein U0929_06115 [Planctomycetaceae bacterium]